MTNNNHDVKRRVGRPKKPESEKLIARAPLNLPPYLNDWLNQAKVDGKINSINRFIIELIEASYKADKL